MGFLPSLLSQVRYKDSKRGYCQRNPPAALRELQLGGSEARSQPGQAACLLHLAWKLAPSWLT